MADTKTADKTQTIEIAEPDKAPESVVLPTREEMRAKGWSAKELDAAEKKGMLAKPEDKKEPEEKPKEEPKKEPEAKTEPEKPAEKPKGGSMPDFTLPPEQEKVFLDTFGPGTPVRAMYFRMKNERHARQSAEARIRELEVENRTIKGQQVKTDEPPADEEDKPLTVKALNDLLQRQAEATRQRQEEVNGRAAKIADAQASQEEYAKSVYSDFDDAVTKAKDLMQNLDGLVPETWKRAKVIKLVRDLQIAAVNADKLGLDDYHAAMIAYEIGQMHPEYGNANAEPPKTGASKENPKGNGALTPEQIKRVEQNTQRRASSASVPNGGGKRTVSVDDVDLATLTAMSFAERRSFRDKFPDQYARLVRG